MTELFTDRVWKKLAPIWETYLEHPFVDALAHGTLEEAKFKHWLKQDYLYLIDYSRLMAIGSAKAPNLNIMQTFSKLLHETLFMEMDLHRQYASKFGISEAELEATQPAETTLAYTSYMLDHSQRGDVSHVAACFLTCAWSYNFIGKAIDDQQIKRENPLYDEWVEMYASDEFTDLTESAKTMLNELADGKTAAELQKLEEIMIHTSYLEYMFWEMAEHQTMWPQAIQQFIEEDNNGTTSS